MITNYKEALAYIYNHAPMFHLVGAAAYKDNLDNTKALSKFTGSPELKFKTIHIAGTNGKGSVSSMLASILMEAGYKTGLFTSPHLLDFRERIRINGKMITKKAITNFISQYETELEKLKPSFFEITFAMAMQYFADQKVDIAVVETGMGGRLDSTNITKPDLSIITNISYDHKQFLGNTLQLIAKEKAGIIKRNTPLVIGRTQSDIKDIFIDAAKKMNAPIHFADQIYKTDNFTINNKASTFAEFNMLKNGELLHSDMHCPSAGNYQQENLQTVFAATDILKEEGIKLSNRCLIDGISNFIKNTGLRGRWQLLAKSPAIICDVAHNEEGITQVLRQIEQLTGFAEKHFVMGMVNDKDYKHILTLLPKDACYYFCKPNIPRGLDEKILYETANSMGLQGKCYTSVKIALENARSTAKEDDLIMICGSLFVVEEVLEHFKK